MNFVSADNDEHGDYRARGAGYNSLQALEGRVAELHVIGDSYQPRDIEMAVVDGHRAGRAIGGGVV